MARLVDRLRAGLVARSPYTALVPEFDENGIVTPSPKAYRDFVEQLRQDVTNCPVVVIDNVAELVLGEGSKELWEVSDIPNAAPPWHVAWYEFRLPTEYGRLNELEEVGMWTASGEREGGGWKLTMWPFARTPNDQDAVGPISVLIADVRADGTVEQVRPGTTAGYDGPDEAYAPMILIIPVLLANAFSHCKNVREEEVAPPEKLSRRYQRKHGVPLTRYRVLQIDPMREVLRREGRSSEIGTKKALHICRGHFKTYDEKPLFNRLTGTYWFPEHVRGRASQGVVKKDYVVSVPAAGGGLVEARVTRDASVARLPPASLVAQIESFSVARAREIVLSRFPGAVIDEMPHSNPGYDIVVREGDQVVRYVEVKGTTRESPAFLITENERNFSVQNGDHYSLVLVGEIDLTAESFVPYWHDGPIDDRFSLRPTGYTAVFPRAE